MSDEHQNEPRDIGYSKSHKDIYNNLTKKGSNSIFAGLKQADVFFFAMAIGLNRNKQKEPKSKVNDIPVNAFTESQKWGILSSEISKEKDLMVLKDERKIYSKAEKYAEEGIKILNSHMEKQGINYPKYLEAELRGILKK